MTEGLNKRQARPGRGFFDNPKLFLAFPHFGNLAVPF